MEQFKLVVKGANPSIHRSSRDEDSTLVDRETDGIWRSISSVPGPRIACPGEPVWRDQRDLVCNACKTRVASSFHVGQLRDDTSNQATGLVHQLFAVGHLLTLERLTDRKCDYG